MAFALCAPLDHCVLDSMLLLQYYGLSCMYVCMYVCMCVCVCVCVCVYACMYVIDSNFLLRYVTSIFYSVVLILFSVISYKKLLSARKLRPKTQSEA